MLRAYDFLTQPVVLVSAIVLGLALGLAVLVIGSLAEAGIIGMVQQEVPRVLRCPRQEKPA